MKKTCILIILFTIPIQNVFSVELDPGGNRVKEGVNQFSKKDYPKSLEKFEEAEKYFPNDERLNFNKGSTYYKNGDYQNAIKEFEKSTSSKSKQIKSSSYYNLGNSYYQLGDKKKAAENYIKSLEADQKNIQAKKNLELIQKDFPKNNQDQNSSDQNFPKQSDSLSPKHDLANQKNQSSDSSHDKLEKKSKLTKEEAEEILNNLDLDKIKKNNGKGKISGVFW